MSGAWADFQAAGLGVVAVSVDKPEAASTTQASWEIPFPVLSDTSLAAHKAFNVVSHVDAATQLKYRGYGIDLEAASGRTDAAIAVPSLFLVVEGRVAWAHVDPAYKVRPDPAQALSAMRAAGALP
jgi:peroxiredoxin